MQGGSSSDPHRDGRIVEHSARINDRLATLISRYLAQVPEKAQGQVSEDLFSLCQGTIKKEKELINIDKVKPTI